MEFFRQVLVIAHKDVRAELRTKEAVNASLAFALVILLLFSFAFDPESDTTREIMGRSWMAQPMPWPNCRPNAVISSGKPKSCAFGHTLHTRSVLTPGLIRSMARSSHSRAFL